MKTIETTLSSGAVMVETVMQNGDTRTFIRPAPVEPKPIAKPEPCPEYKDTSTEDLSKRWHLIKPFARCYPDSVSSPTYSRHERDQWERRAEPFRYELSRIERELKARGIEL